MVTLCKICNFKNDCNKECKHVHHCKLNVVRGMNDEEILRVKRMNSCGRRQYFGAVLHDNDIRGVLGVSFVCI